MTRALVSLFAAFLPLLAIMMGQSPLLQLQSQFQQAKGQYTQALQNTRLQLTELGRELKTNPVLTQDLNDQSYGAASRILGGYVVPGRVDQLAIVDQDCRYLAHSEQGLLLSAECPLQSRDADTSRFQWRRSAGRPQLEWVMPLAAFGERRLILIASTSLKDSWLFSFEPLQLSFRNLDLSIADNPEELRSTNWFLRHVPSLLGNDPVTLQKPLWIALLVLVLAFLNVLRELKKREETWQKEMQNLQQWARDLQAETPDITAADALAQIQGSLNKLVKRNYEQLQACRQHSHGLSQQIVGLEARILDQQVEQAWLQKARSLHQQMNGSAQAHLQKLQDIQGLGDDISHLAAAQMVRPAQKLYELGQRWAEELRTVPPRKLVRSMAERVDEKGVSQLEQAVNTLIESSQDLSNSAINITLLSQTLLEQLKENVQLAEHWHRLMGGPDKGQKSLRRLIDESQSLIGLQEKDLQLRYDNQVDEQLLPHLKVPDSTLHSVLYHCQMALIELARERGWANPTLHYQCKKRDDKVILVLSLRGPADDDVIQQQLPRHGEQHQQLAQQLLQGYGMKLTRLPPLQGIQALALMWDQEASVPAHSRPARTMDQT